MISAQTKLNLLLSCMEGLQSELKKEHPVTQDTIDWAIEYIDYCVELVKRL